MKFVDLKDGHFQPSNRVLTPEEHAALVAEYMKEFDPVQAEAEYRDMIENGGIDFEDLMRNLEEIDRRVRSEKP